MVVERTATWYPREARVDRDTALAPIEIEVPCGPAVARHVEIAIDGAVLRVEVGADVEYVGALVRQLRGTR